MLSEQEEKELTVPEWVKSHFKDVSEPNPTTSASFQSEDEIALSYAKREAILASQNIEFLTNPEQVKEERRRLAENLLILGETERAWDYADSEELKSRIDLVETAITEPDNNLCFCHDDFSQFTETFIPLSRFRVLQRIYSPAHHRMIDVKICNKCGFVNATDLLTETENLIKKKTAGVSKNTSDEEIFR